MALGLVSSLALLAMLALNMAQLARYAQGLTRALRMSGNRGTVVDILPSGEPNVVMLRPRTAPSVNPAGSALRLAA